MRLIEPRKSVVAPISTTPVQSQPRAGGELLELEQQHGLADAAQARVDEAAALLAGLEAAEQRVEALQIAVAAGEERRHRPGARAVRDSSPA